MAVEETGAAAPEGRREEGRGQRGPDAGGPPGEFERYALIAALTLVVLCLLVWDRWHDGSSARPPSSAQALRVSIGGDAARPPSASPKATPPVQQPPVSPAVSADV